MTNEEFALELDYCYAQLNPVTVERTIDFTTGNVEVHVYKQKVTQENIDRMKSHLLKCLKECRIRGYFKGE